MIRRPYRDIQPESASEEDDDRSQDSEGVTEQQRDQPIGRNQPKKIVINEGRNRFHHIQDPSSGQEAIEEQSGEESDSEASSSESSKNSGSNSNDGDSNEDSLTHSHSNTSDKERLHHRNDKQEKSSQSEDEDEVDYIETRIQKLERDLEEKMNQNCLKPTRTESGKPKSDRPTVERKQLPPRSRPTENRRTIQQLEVNKENKSLEKIKPRRANEQREMRPTSGKATVTLPNRKNIERKPLKENINTSNINKSVEKRSFPEKKPIVPKVVQQQRKAENPSRNEQPRGEPSQPSRSREGRVQTTSLSKERSDIYKLKNAISNTDSFKLEQEIQLLKVVESIRAKLKKSISRKLKQAQEKPDKLRKSTPSSMRVGSALN